jgi:hypothetical protein
MSKEVSNKYKFTPELDTLIIKAYQNNIGKRGLIKKLAIATDIPRYVISRHARNIGAYTPLKKAPEWEEKELKILGKNSIFALETIQRKLKEHGYHRSCIAIFLKRKRMRFLKNLDGMSATKAAEFFGVDNHWVLNRIKEGLLPAEMRNTKRTSLQGGDIYYIKESDLREFIIKNPELIDMRKVEKFYFIELLANGGVH